MNPRPIRLTVDEAWRLWSGSRDAYAREWLVVHYASLVKFVAGRLAAGLPKRVEIGDLVSAGMFGLMDAVEKFDPLRGFKFETYAVPRIRGAILDGLRALDWVPRSVRSRARSVEQAISDLEHSLKRAPTDEELAARLGIGTAELDQWLSDVAASTVGPLDHLVADRTAAGTHGSARINATPPTSPEAAVEADAVRDVMRREITRLPERERVVLALYYDENLTLQEIGDVLGVTESRVSQIHSKAVLRLRSRLSAADVG
ncbi:MAG: FliA/WhiG family RNA polymerase sigma factor [Ilumatobacteraceae bacterium]